MLQLFVLELLVLADAALGHDHTILNHGSIAYLNVGKDDRVGNLRLLTDGDLATNHTLGN